MPYDLLVNRRVTVEELLPIERDLRRIENAEGLTFDGPNGIAEQGRLDAIAAIRPYLATISPYGALDPVVSWHYRTTKVDGLRVPLEHIVVDDAMLELLKWATLRAFYRAASKRRKQEDGEPLGGEAEMKRALSALFAVGVALSVDDGATIYGREPLLVPD